VALTIPRNINTLATILDTQDNLDTEQLDQRATFPKGKLAKLIELVLLRLTLSPDVAKHGF
jgi:hypothetical protein